VTISDAFVVVVLVIGKGSVALALRLLPIDIRSQVLLGRGTPLHLLNLVNLR
jgi:hypothetical protein